MERFEFKHMRSPAWCYDSANSIYFKVYWITEENKYEIGYIGCQENDFGRGLINNICYKTFENFRNKGLTKKYIKEFLSKRILDVDCIRARVDQDNIASQKVLEYAGFELKVHKRADDGKIGYTWKAF